MQTPTAYFNKLQHKCQSHLDAFCSNPKPEDLHGLRVSIKKINALLRLVKKSDDSFHFRRRFKPYREIFKQAGKIREAQLQLDAIGNSPIKPLAAKANSLTALVKTETKKFNSHCPGFKKSIKKADDKPAKWIEEISAKDLQKYFTDSIAAINADTRALNSPVQLHPFRKQIKRFMYNAEMIGKAQHQKLNLKKLMPVIDKMQDLIGKWHDTDLMINSLKNPRKDKQISTFINKLKKERDKQLMELESLLSNLRNTLSKQ